MVISYFFPPLGGGGVQRTLKFVKYLSKFNWQSLVLTAKNTGYHARDNTLLSDVPKGTNVTRSFTIEPNIVSSFARFILKLLLSFKNKKLAINRSDVPENLNVSRKRKIKDFLLSLYQTFFFPDDKIGWLPLAFFHAYKIRTNVELIYTTSPPHSVQLIGLFMKIKSKKPWVVDFRDPWSQSSYLFYWKFLRKFSQYLERLVLNKADHIIVASHGIKREFFQIHKNIPKRKISVITNGYDPDDFSDINNRNYRKRKFIISHTGTIYGERSLSIFIGILIEWIKENPIIEKKFEFQQVGTVGIDEGKKIKNQINSSGFSGLFKTYGYLNHKKTIQILKESTLLILINSDDETGKVTLPGKLFEYIALKKPILALVPDGEAQQLIDETGCGVVVNPNKPDKIKEILSKLYKYYSTGTLSNHFKFKNVDRFDREKLTGELVRILNTVTNLYNSSR